MSDFGLGVIVAGQIGAFSGASKSAAKKSVRKIGTITANITIEERHTDTLEITQHPIEQGAAITDHAYKRPAEVVIKVGWSNSPTQAGSLLGGIAGAIQNKLVGAATNALTNAASKAIGGSGIGNLAVSEIGKLATNAATSLGISVNSGKGKGTSLVQDVYQSLLKLQASAVPFDVYTGKRTYKNMLIQTMVVETDRTTENALIATLTCQQVILVSTQIVAVGAADDKQKEPEKTAAPTDEGAKQAQPVDPKQDQALQKALILKQNKS